MWRCFTSLRLQHNHKPNPMISLWLSPLLLKICGQIIQLHPLDGFCVSHCTVKFVPLKFSTSNGAIRSSGTIKSKSSVSTEVQFSDLVFCRSPPFKYPNTSGWVQVQTAVRFSKRGEEHFQELLLQKQDIDRAGSSQSLLLLLSSPTTMLLYCFCCCSLKDAFTLALFRPPSLQRHGETCRSINIVQV